MRIRSAAATLALSVLALLVTAGAAHADDDDGTICGYNTAAYGYHVKTCIHMHGLDFGSPAFDATTEYTGGSTDVRFWVYIKRSDTSDTLAQYPAAGQPGLLTVRDSASGLYSGSTNHLVGAWPRSNVWGHCYTATTLFTESGTWHWGGNSDNGHTVGFCI
ncbi:hypothetical protein GCM10010193_32470 [Kitasatospora atroaurantiaca]|uniref:Peptidase inhibitor family I36 n=1 Tax=Kitasatospora atroaurantiaca TaxID=285545 RepID=A0A561ERI9_9ACTN|nr:hypothetical protein [Kitasatospora atroaurantiaca]TWE18232.1 hypothetical protein FB465_3283 [Kitasatospora atroaurantiaca]